MAFVIKLQVTSLLWRKIKKNSVRKTERAFAFFGILWIGFVKNLMWIERNIHTMIEPSAKWNNVSMLVNCRCRRKGWRYSLLTQRNLLQTVKDIKSLLSVYEKDDGSYTR